MLWSTGWLCPRAVPPVTSGCMSASTADVPVRAAVRPALDWRWRTCVCVCVCARVLDVIHKG